MPHSEVDTCSDQSKENSLYDNQPEGTDSHQRPSRLTVFEIICPLSEEERKCRSLSEDLWVAKDERAVLDTLKCDSVDNISDTVEVKERSQKAVEGPNTNVKTSVLAHEHVNGRSIEKTPDTKAKVSSTPHVDATRDEEIKHFEPEQNYSIG